MKRSEVKELIRTIVAEIRREDMPQTKSKDSDKVIDGIKNLGVGVSRIMAGAGTFSPSQENFNRDKVESMKLDFIDANGIAPIFVSNDNKIVDGHHRWMAAKEKFGDDCKMKAYMIDRDLNGALDVYDKVSKVVSEMAIRKTTYDDKTNTFGEEKATPKEVARRIVLNSLEITGYWREHDVYHSSKMTSREIGLVEKQIKAYLDRIYRVLKV